MTVSFSMCMEYDGMLCDNASGLFEDDKIGF